MKKIAGFPLNGLSVLWQRKSSIAHPEKTPGRKVLHISLYPLGTPTSYNDSEANASKATRDNTINKNPSQMSSRFSRLEEGEFSKVF